MYREYQAAFARSGLHRLRVGDQFRQSSEVLGLRRAGTHHIHGQRLGGAILDCFSLSGIKPSLRSRSGILSTPNKAALFGRAAFIVLEQIVI